VEELRETQPDCRIYVALTKCDRLRQPPRLGAPAQPDPPAEPAGGSDTSSNGASLIHA
jgi:hypothetical protein